MSLNLGNITLNIDKSSDLEGSQLSAPIRWVKAEAILELDLVDGNTLARLVEEGIVDSKCKKKYSGEEVIYLKEADVLRAARAKALKPSAGLKSRAKDLAHDSFVASVASAISALTVGSWLTDYGPNEWERQIFDVIARLEEEVAHWRTRRADMLRGGGFGISPYEGPPFKSFSIGNSSFMMPIVDEIAEAAGISLGHNHDPDPTPSILPGLNSEFRWPDNLIRSALSSDQGYPNLDFRVLHGGRRIYGNRRDYFEKQWVYGREFLREVFSISSPFLSSLTTNPFIKDYHLRFCEVCHVRISNVECNDDLKDAFYWNMLVFHSALEELSPGN